MNKIIIGNLKMHLISLLERERYFELLKKEISNKKLSKVQFVLCPPTIHLEAFSKNINKIFSLGVQNFFWEKEGSFTGEISADMARGSGAEFAIIGHSERRKYFCEKDEEINLKVKAALKAGLCPIICVGEKRSEKEAGETLPVIVRQMTKSLQGVQKTKIEQIIIAYEPVWAVGTDVTPTANEIMEAKVLIRKILVSFFGKKYAEKVRIIYGGSVNTKNAKKICLEPGMDGVLVGRESLAPHEFVKIAEIIND
jgi:triosephosphate isomerase (TIM)